MSISWTVFFSLIILSSCYYVGMGLQRRQLKDFPEYYEQMISLVENSFGYKPAYNIARDFAPLFSKNSKADNILFFDKNNQLIGHIGLLKKNIVYKECRFPVILLGGVCVASKYRGQGHLKEMMAEALSLFEGQYLFAFLWSSMTEMYEKFGFYEAGQVVQTGNQGFVTPPSGFKKVDIDKCPQSTWKWIQDSYNNRPSHEAYLERTPFDWEIIQEMKSVSLYVNEVSKEYFMINKGMDLPGIIHEYTPHLNLNNELQKFPTWTHPQKLGQVNFSHTLFLSFIKIGAEEKLADFLAIYSNGQIILKKIQNKTIELEIDGCRCQKHPSDFLGSLFGPGQPLVKGLQPVCFTIGGVDSV